MKLVKEVLLAGGDHSPCPSCIQTGVCMLPVLGLHVPPTACCFQPFQAWDREAQGSASEGDMGYFWAWISANSSTGGGAAKRGAPALATANPLVRNPPGCTFLPWLPTRVAPTLLLSPHPGQELGWWRVVHLPPLPELHLLYL